MSQLPIFKWTGISRKGIKLSGEITAQTAEEVIQKLKNQSIHVITLQKKHLFQPFKKSNSIKPLTMIFLFRQLATLISTSIPIADSLTILANHHANELNHILLSIKLDLEKGISLSMSLNKFSKQFDKLTCQLIYIGEQTGTLATMLTHLATHKEYYYSIRQKIQQSLLYPIILFIIACCVTLVLLLIVIPRFADLFQSMHAPLPKLTSGVIFISQAIKQYYWIFFIGWIAIGLIIHYCKKWNTVKPFLDKLQLTFPVIGHIYTKLFLIRFSQSMGMMLQAGLPIAQALNMLAETTPNRYTSTIIYSLYLMLAKGIPLYKCMQNYPVFPPMMRQMVKVGEESGATEQMLKKISDIYHAEVTHFMNLLTQALEPLIMIILGVLIGGLVIAMYLPIFKLGNVM